MDNLNNPDTSIKRINPTNSQAVQPIRIGIVGLDSSRCVTFAKLLQERAGTPDDFGAVITAAYPGGSPDFEFCYSRLDGFVTQMREQYGTVIVQTVDEVAERCDALFLLSGDGRVHLEQFRAIAPYGKPVFIDKPLTVSYAEALELARIAVRHNLPWMSSSALRYTDALQAAIRNGEKGEITGADSFGPLVIEETQPGLYWYGIHAVETLYAVMGKGCAEVRAVTNKDHDVITAIWEDGRLGSIRGNRTGNHQFSTTIHRQLGSDYIGITQSSKGYYANQLRSILEMCRKGNSSENEAETLEIIQFIDAANESRITGRPVKLETRVSILE